MPDTGPITDSFPWLVVKYRPVFDNQNVTQSVIVLTDDSGTITLTDDSGTIVLVSDQPAGSPGDRYRLI